MPAATMNITSDANLMTVTAVEIRIASLESQGLGESVRCNALRCRLHADGVQLLPLPAPAGKVAKLVEESGKIVIILPSGHRSAPKAMADAMPNFAALVSEGLVEVKAMVYKNFRGGTGEEVFSRTTSDISPNLVFALNETEQTETAQIRGAFTGEVVLKGKLSDSVLAEIEPFLAARKSQQRRNGSTVRVYNNPLYLVAAAMLQAA